MFQKYSPNTKKRENITLSKKNKNYTSFETSDYILSGGAGEKFFCILQYLVFLIVDKHCDY